MSKSGKPRYCLNCGSALKGHTKQIVTDLGFMRVTQHRCRSCGMPVRQTIRDTGKLVYGKDGFRIEK